MSSKPVVRIDDFNITHHQRYAADQANFVKEYITDSVNAGPFFEVIATTSTYASKLSALLGTNQQNTPWAYFAAPENFALQRNRFFAFQILTNFHWIDEKEDEEGKEGELSEEEKKELLKKIIKEENLVVIYTKQLIEKIEAVEKTQETRRIFEKEKTSLLNLVACIRYLNKMIAQIKMRRLQLQKA